MTKSVHILILEDSPVDAELVQYELKEAGFAFTSKVVMTEKDFVHELQECCPDIILSDYDLPAYNGALALAEVMRRCPDVPFILVTGAVGEDRAIEILTQGAKDYVLKSRLQRLAPAVQRALAEAEEHRARKVAEEELSESHRNLVSVAEKRSAALREEINEHRIAKEHLQVHQVELTMQNEELRRIQVQLEAVRASYFDLYELAPVGYVTFSERGTIIQANLAAATLFSVTRDELAKMPFSRFIFKDDKDIYFRFHRRLFEACESQACELRMAKNNGAVFWAYLKASVDCDVAAGVLGRVVISDITERKQAEEALQQRTHELGERVKELNCLYGVSNLAETSGESPDLLLRAVVELLPKAWQYPSITCARITFNGQTYSTDNFEQTPWRQQYPIHVLGTQVGSVEVCYLEAKPDSDEGPFLQEEGLLLDAVAKHLGKVIERIQTQQALRESEEMKQEILDSISEAFFSLDDNMVVNYFNSTAERILNRKAGEMIGRRLFDAIPEARGSVFEENYVQCIRSKTALFFETRFDVAPYENWYEVRLYPEKHGIAVFFRVITERKQAEEEIRILTERLEQQVAELNAANRELESFSYSISHDLRAPLRAINGFSRMLARDLKGKVDEESMHRLDTIRNNGLKMNQLIDEVLAFSRLSQESMTMTIINMEDLATDAWNELQGNNLEQNISINIAHLMACYGDQKMMRRVLTNLLSNAAKFTKASQPATIEVGSYEEEHEYVYYVKDNGCGFDRQYSDKLFRLFQRLHSETDYEGTGAGLSIVKRIVERHGGRVWAEGTVNEGATFYFTVPKYLPAPIPPIVTIPA